MTTFHAQQVLQYMNAQEDAPLTTRLGLELVSTNVIEGASVRVNIKRKGRFDTDVSVRWTATAPAGNLTGVTTGIVSLAPNIETASFVVTTVNLANTQGDRAMQLVLSEPANCDLDPDNDTAAIVISDRPPFVMPAWTQLPVISGRTWATGVADIGNDADLAYAEAAYLNNTDVGYGVSGGTSWERCNTWDNLIGGPVGVSGIDSIPNTSQMDWLVHLSRFSIHLKAVSGPSYPNGSRWLVWGGAMIPSAQRTDTGNAAVWSEIASGAHATKHQKMGERIAQLLARKGQLAKRLIIVLNPECNKGNFFQVFENSRLAYKAAMERVINDIRTGAGTAGADIRFCHLVAQEFRIGQLSGWTPTNVDCIGMTFLPDNRCDTAAKVDNLIAGTLTPNMYGISTDLADAAVELNLPVIFPMWGPRWEWGTTVAEQVACPRGYDVVNKMINGVLAGLQPRLIGDALKGRQAWDRLAYAGTQSGGSTQYSAGVDLLKLKYGGTAVPAGWTLDHTAPDAVNEWVQWGGAGGGITVASPVSDGLRMYGGPNFDNDTNRLTAWFKRQLPATGWAIELDYRRNESTPPVAANPGTASMFYVGKGVGIFQPDIISTTGSPVTTPSLSVMNANVEGGRSTYNTAYSTDPLNNDQIRFNTLPDNTQRGVSPNEFPFTPGVWYRIRREMVDGILTQTVTNLSDNTVKSWSIAQATSNRVWGLYQQPHRDLNVRNVRVYSKPGTLPIGGTTPPEPPPTTGASVPRALFPEGYTPPSNQTFSASPSQLQGVINNAKPGDWIQVYGTGSIGTLTFPATVNGTAAKPIVVQVMEAMGSVSITNRINMAGSWCVAAGFRFTGSGTKVFCSGPNNRYSRGLFDGCGLLGFDGDADTTGWTVDRVEMHNFSGQVLPDGVKPGGKWKGWRFTKFYIHNHRLAASSNEAICTVMTAGKDESNHLYEDWLFDDCCKVPSSGTNTGQAEIISAKVGKVTFRRITITNCDSYKPFRLVLRNTHSCTVEGFWCDGGSFMVVHGKGHQITNCKHENDSSIVMELENGDSYYGDCPGGCTASFCESRNASYWNGSKCVGGHAATEDTVVENCASRIGIGRYDGNKPVRNVTLRNNKYAAVADTGTGHAPTGSYTQTGVGSNVTTAYKLTPAEVGYDAP